MKIALVQTNPVIGDFRRNTGAVLSWAEKARAACCDAVIFPELTLCGCPPQDLLDRSSFRKAHEEALNVVVRELPDITCIIGVLESRSGGAGKLPYNSAFVVEGGRIVHCARKQLLPAHDVFAETRYFEPGSRSKAFALDGLYFGISVGDDLACQKVPLASLLVGALVPDCIVNIAASPYYHGKLQERQAVFSQRCREYTTPILYVNQVGGQDSLVFDGHSMALTAEGRVLQVGKGFAEDMLIVDTDDLYRTSVSSQPLVDSVEKVNQALVLGVNDYLHKSGFDKAVIGLSGGIDSAVTAVVACQALGADKVSCVAMPSPYTSQASIDDARELASRLGCHFQVLPISAVMDAYHEVLAPLFTGLEEDTAGQNIQARIRGNLLMALSNITGAMLLSTGNKSEIAVGYCTLYGDMSGGLAVLADVPKVMVYELAALYNRDREVIPEHSITRAPTAELKPGQCDQDDLPAYEVLDPILSAYLEGQKSVDEIVALGFDAQVVRDIIRRVTINEHKRRQAPPGIKVTCKAFGQGRRYPVVQGYQE